MISKINFILKKLNINYRIPHLDTIVLYVNTLCNAKCFMCDIGQRNRRNVKKGITNLSGSKKFMTTDLLKKIITDKFVQKTKPEFYILMTEPLLSENIIEIIKLIKNSGFYVGMSTNGYLLPQKAHELATSGIDNIQVSLDGPRELHNYIRGDGFYENATKGIEILNKISKIPITINYTVFNMNYNCISELLEEISHLKINKFKIQFLDFVSKEMVLKQNKYKMKITESSLSEFVDPSKVDVNVLYRELVKIKKTNYDNITKIEIHPNISKEEMKKYFDTKGEKIRNYDKCAIPFKQISIRPDGKVLFHMRCFNYVIGDIEKNSIKEIFFGRSANIFRKELIKAKLCFPACTRCCGVIFT